MAGTCIPFIKSLQDEYIDSYGIDIAGALDDLSNKDENLVGSWILPWTEMLASCVQIQCALKEPKIKACVPKWVSQKLQTIMEKYGPYADALDLQGFEDICYNREWMIDRILMTDTTSATQNNQVEREEDLLLKNSGGNIIHLCISECINHVHRRQGILKASEKMRRRLPLNYVPSIMNALADGISMSIRIRNAGACIQPLCASAGTGGHKGRKRNRDNNDDNDEGIVAANNLPNFSNSIDFGPMNQENELEEDFEEV